MAKHPVPKKKTTKRVTKQRYGSFQTKTLNKLTGLVNLTVCPDCGAKNLSHTVCKECGKYRGKQIIDKTQKAGKVTTIKA
ncbi:50S ribosomal protein L32 [Candidatus Gracilibacteria bacterium]|nr:50S ribosomal protein L32 [Candidatus Gracilibacteria bacterium]